MKTEYLIREVDGDSRPWGFTDWTLEEAQAAAQYNSERWGPHEVVTREVSEWQPVE
ncbi:hypothetical protein N806_29825 [Rhodococcus sp. P27]|nr:hypothetical protein N806_29825 [Rhodococcus sp. P27]